MVDCAVCIATYNGENYICDQISSIVTQLGPSDILFVSDDGSSDRTLEIIKSYGEKVKIVGCCRVGGVVNNFERALSAAYLSGARNIILSDQDDVWFDGRMGLIRQGLAEADVVVTNGYITDRFLNFDKTTIFDRIGVRRGFFANFARPTYVGCCMAFRRDVLSLALPFPKTLPWHDWFISLIGEAFFSIKLDCRPSIYYRRHGGNLSETGGKSKNGILKKINLRLLMLKAMSIVVFRYFSKYKHFTRY